MRDIMRAHSDQWFAGYLLRIGDGKEERMVMVAFAFQTRYVCRVLGRRTPTLIN
jgi:hypothetical protein